MSHGRLRLRGWLTPCSALSNVYANRSSLGTGVREIAQRAARASQILEQETKALMTWLQAKGCGVERAAAGAPRRPGHDQAPGGGRGAAALDPKEKLASVGCQGCEGFAAERQLLCYFIPQESAETRAGLGEFPCAAGRERLPLEEALEQCEQAGRGGEILA